MLKIGIFPNFKKNNIIDVIKSSINILKQKNVEIFFTREVAESIGMSELGKSLNEIISSIDMAIVFGGDGTFLNIARKMAPYDIPILGVNFGHLGFLTEVEVPEINTALEKITKNEFHIEQRMMLEAVVLKNNEENSKFIALNDIVITKGPLVKVVRLETYINDEYVETYPADGLIISSPTGSTAYSLSAGGPIVNPNINLMVITPICPHTLYSRSIVISDKEKVKVKINANHQEIMLTVDGQEGFKLMPNDVVEIQKSRYTTKLIRLKNKSFYEVLRKKLTDNDS
ncbi:MAG: kinase [Thermosediminibacterales bacterium]|nr:kinase [Thermosediminibacterales bacterium]